MTVTDDSRGQDDRSGTPSPTEGVRIIGAVEATSAVGQPTVEIPKIEILDDDPDIADGDPDVADGDPDTADGVEEHLFPEIDEHPLTPTAASAPVDRTPSRFGSVPVIRPDMDPPTGAVPEVVPDQPWPLPATVRMLARRRRPVARTRASPCRTTPNPPPARCRRS